MKKNFVRIIAALLVGMLALTLLPMGAFAIEDKPKVEVGLFEKNDPSLNDGWFVYDEIEYEPGATIKTNQYEDTLIYDGYMYDFEGFINTPAITDAIKHFYKSNPDATTDQFQKFIEGTEIPFTSGNIKIPAEGTKEYDDFLNNWYVMVAGYTPHQHKLSYWYSDGTTHWRECLVCKRYDGFHDPFMYQNWCQDGDEDGICNICGGDVPYHDVTVIEEEGGKIIVNRDNACHRMKITADVEPAEGYKLKKLHFTKVRDNGSKQEITRYKKNGQFWTYMPTYELEVTAEFVKTK